MTDPIDDKTCEFGFNYEFIDIKIEFCWKLILIIFIRL